MRHAKSDWSGKSRRDFERPLAKRGLKDAPRMGRWVADNNLAPGLIVSSPAERARQTAELAREEMRLGSEKLVFEQDIYEASLEALLGVLAVYAGLASDLMLVGHNPGLDALLEHLSGSPPPCNPAGKLMTTAAIAVLEFEDGITARQGTASLLALVRPKEL